MKTRKKLLLALLSATCVTAGAFGLAACGSKPSANDTRDPDIVAVYTAYVASAEANNETVLTYEQWLETVKGAAGTDGVDGATWLSGAADPVATAGKVGDFYLNTATFDVFKKGTDGWGTSICNLKGADGTASKGEDGATWLSGEDAPAATAGKEGDFYLDTKTSDVYKKTAEGWGTPICNLTGATGATGGTGAAGAAGVGIAGVTLNADNKLEITFTKPLDSDDPTSNKVIIDLPEAFFHKHTYSDNKYDDLLVAPGATTSGLAYKVCTGTVDGDACGHIELVALPELGDGTEAHPYLINYNFAEAENSVYQTLIPESQTLYYAFMPEEDGYFYVTTPTSVDDWYGSLYYACEFNVRNGSTSFTQTDSQSYLPSQCTVKAGQPVTIFEVKRSSKYGGFTGTDDQRYVEFAFFATGTEKEYSVTVTDPEGNPSAGAVVEVYTYNEGDYTPVADVAAVTTGEDGVAKFNLPMGDYYFSVTPTDTDTYKTITVNSRKAHINLRPDNFNATVALEEIILPVKNGDALKAGQKYSFAIAGINTKTYALKVSGGKFYSTQFIVPEWSIVENIIGADGSVLSVGEFSESIDCKVTDGVVKEIANLSSQTVGADIQLVFKVSEDCTLTIDDGTGGTDETTITEAGEYTTLEVGVEYTIQISGNFSLTVSTGNLTDVVLTYVAFEENMVQELVTATGVRGSYGSSYIPENGYNHVDPDDENHNSCTVKTINITFDEFTADYVSDVSVTFKISEECTVKIEALA